MRRNDYNNLDGLGTCSGDALACGKNKCVSDILIFQRTGDNGWNVVSIIYCGIQSAISCAASKPAKFFQRKDVQICGWTWYNIDRLSWKTSKNQFFNSLSAWVMWYQDFGTQRMNGKNKSSKWEHGLEYIKSKIHSGLEEKFCKPPNRYQSGLNPAVVVKVDRKCYDINSLGCRSRCLIAFFYTDKIGKNETWFKEEHDITYQFLKTKNYFNEPIAIFFGYALSDRRRFWEIQKTIPMKWSTHR